MNFKNAFLRLLPIVSVLIFGFSIWLKMIDSSYVDTFWFALCYVLSSIGIIYSTLNVFETKAIWSVK